ncbi:uncharacterized protein LOC117317022 [Pecten maximus]|uniref:uncharacterized protein LOC117317022 n=1 Tax=Pecten maximus TaxID=6579 RepID=UPI001458498E|nr:uncharacterized protein LOC117317022 [Pecten maximus]
MASIFRRQRKVFTLKELYESKLELPVIIYIEEGFAGNNAVETIGAGQYFFIHAIYRQRRAMTRGHVPAVSSDKCLLSIPVGYPIKFRHVESRTKVGPEDFMWSLLRKLDPPFQVQMSRTDRRRLSVGPVSTSTSNISNLLVTGKYKEIYLLGNLLNHGTGSLYYRNVTAIPLYVPEVKVRVVDGFSVGMKGDWTMYIDELYAFALQEIDLHGTHGNMDISVFMDKKESFETPRMCEFLVPDRYLSLQWPEEKSAVPNPQQFQPSLKEDKHRYSEFPTTKAADNKRRPADKPSQTTTGEGDDVIHVFSQDYTPLDEIRDMKRPVPEPRQRNQPTAPPEDELVPPLPPRNRGGLDVVKGTSNVYVRSQPDQDEFDGERKAQRRGAESMPHYEKNKTVLQRQLSKELLKMCEKRKNVDVEGKTPGEFTEPDIDYDYLPSKCEGETDNKCNDGKHGNGEYYVTHRKRKDQDKRPDQSKATFDPHMPLAEMTIDGVAQVLGRLNLYKYEADFRSQQIDGFMLMKLTDDTLQSSFGFTVLESLRLMNFILHKHLPRMQ